jgi:glycosyltransferase involved in cell wall biosynthesis
MRLVLLTHPVSLKSVSMPRFAGMILRGMAGRGHEVKLWTSRPVWSRLPVRSSFLRKWLGYADQFLMYPQELRQQMNREPDDTLFVVTDQALGMWVPHLAHRPHVIHCHDFLALKSALGEFPENPTRWTGRQYQRLIRKGFACGRAFISVSEKTRNDLHRFLPVAPNISEVVYNGLNHCFRPMDPEERNSLLKQTGVEISDNGFVVHIGGNQWYKNRIGVLKIYHAYAAFHPRPPALWMIGTAPTTELFKLATDVSLPGRVHFLTELTNEQVNAAYSQARALLFPSLEEGFGWPIAEAMAAGCPVLTTSIAPMTEVGGTAAHLIPRMPAQDAARQKEWATSAAAVLNEVVSRDAISRAKLIEAGRLNAARFDAETALAAYEEIYEKVLTASRN